MLRSIIKYHGGKNKLARWIINLMPPHKVYVEPYGGGASVLLQKPMVNSEIYNDLEGEVYNLFKVVRDRAEELAAVVSMTTYNRREMELAYIKSNDDLERARRMIVRCHQAIKTTSMNDNSGFRTSINSKDYCSQFKTFATLPKVIFQVRDRLASVAIENRPALSLLERFDTKKTLFYLDPPYPNSTRSNKSKYSGYKFNMTDEDHKELLTKIKELKGFVIISSYENDLYETELIGWTKHFRKAYNDANKETKEVVWCNFEPVSKQGEIIFN